MEGSWLEGQDEQDGTPMAKGNRDETKNTGGGQWTAGNDIMHRIREAYLYRQQVGRG